MPAINLGMPHHKGDDWRDKAECASIGGDLWFSDHWQDQVKAKDVCGRCLVKDDCLNEAVANDEHWGVWRGVKRINDNRTCADCNLVLSLEERQIWAT